MLIDTAMWYNGIRMYDENDNMLIDETWGEIDEWTEWSKPQYIPVD